MWGAASPKWVIFLLHGRCPFPEASPTTTYSVFTADGSIARRAEVIALGHGSRHVGLTNGAFSWKFIYEILNTYFSARLVYGISRTSKVIGDSSSLATLWLQRDTTDAPEQARVKKYSESHAKATREWDNFRRTQELQCLREAAGILAKAHRDLQKDKEFWKRLRSLPDRLEEEDHQAEVENLLQDFDAFLAFEESVFVQVAALPRQEARKLLDDVNDAVRDRDRALRMVRSKINEDTVDNLRDRSKELQEAMDTAHAELSAVLTPTGTESAVEGHRRYRWSFDVRKSLLFTSGVVQISINSFLLAPIPAATGSMLSGIQAMIQQFPEDLWKAIETVMKDKWRGLRDAWDPRRDR
jgi:hypothetical protein